ncbi:MAG: PKD domain-containing protein [Bacteroidota bacterium]|nr:PKD domain-containing protein [Bacteroidota bacterium]
MKIKTLKVSFIVFSLGMILIFSCKKGTEDSSVIASFDFSDTIIAGKSVIFENISKNASQYLWNFGDGTTSTVKNPSHTFTSNGIYTVSLVSSGTNGVDTASVDVVVGTAFIFPGKGIPDAVIGNSWATIKGTYGVQDTSNYISYNSDYGYYFHGIVYKNQNIVFYFGSSSYSISDDDVLIEISIISSNTGMTSKGIKIGSSISKVKKSYGTPLVITNSSSTSYCYDLRGISFVASSSSPNVVKQIEIYPASSSSQKNISIGRLWKLRNYIFFK